MNHPWAPLHSTACCGHVGQSNRPWVLSFAPNIAYTRRWKGSVGLRPSWYSGLPRLKCGAARHGRTAERLQRKDARREVVHRCASAAAQEPTPCSFEGGGDAVVDADVERSQGSCTSACSADTDARPRGSVPSDHEASSSGGKGGWNDEEELPHDVMVALAAGAPLAAINWANLRPSTIKKEVERFRDRVYYGDVLPPIGSQQLSYSRFLQLLKQRRIKRVILLNEGKVAMVEIPVKGYESDYMQGTYDRLDMSIMYAPPNPEWTMEKYRYYVDLPGDMWEEGAVMSLIKRNMGPRIRDDGRVEPYDMLRVGQVYTELVVMDPKDALVWLNQYADQLVPITLLLALRVFVGAADSLLKLLGREKKDPMQELAEEYGRHRAREFNVGKDRKDTGVRYDDVAGIDNIKADIQEVMKMVVGDKQYQEIGAHPFRGIMLTGPPGTGKTLLAKAMAGDSGVPFFSCNGSEFVEMFGGVAAARIRDLFRVARKYAPSIIFIDEIDAIAKARGAGGGDTGTQEREQGLLQLLYEMDGFRTLDQVLIIAATNRVDALDDALLRPGRFDRLIYMGRPSTPNRFKILQVHARGKPIPHEGNEIWESDALLHRVADLTIGYSGAELANLLNEAAILMVRKGREDIDLDLIREAVDKRSLGLATGRLPPSDAKRRIALVEAARGVAACLTPGMPPVVYLTIAPRGGSLSRLTFIPQEFGEHGGDWHRLYSGVEKVNAVPAGKPLSHYEMACGLLVPLYVPRAAEEVLFGKMGVTLQSARELAKAGDLAQWLVQYSTLQPAMRGLPVRYGMSLGGRWDPTVNRRTKQFVPLITRLQTAAHRRAVRLIEERRTVIEQVADELLAPDNKQELVDGHRIVELLENTPLDKATVDVDPSSTSQRVGSRMGLASFGWGTGTVGQAGFLKVQQDAVAGPAYEDVRLGGANASLARAVEAVIGRMDMQELTALDFPAGTEEELREQLAKPGVRERLEAQQRFARSAERAPDFPPPPASLPDYQGDLLEDWVSPSEDTLRTNIEDINVVSARR